MLLAALGLTILGFVALIIAVATGTIAFAWVCIVAGIVGFVLLLVDAARAVIRRRGERGEGARGTGRGTSHARR